MSIRRSALITLTLLSAVVFAVGSADSASAAVRYASPNGVSSPLCDQATPCDIFSAIVDAPNFGDEVVLAPGNYGSPAAPLLGVMLSVKVAKIAPAVGAARPHLFIGGTGFLSIYNGGTIADIDIDSTSTSVSGSLFGYLPVLQRVVVHSTKNTACRLVHDATIENSVCATTAPGATGLEIYEDGGYAMSTNVRNVTASSSDPGGKGMTMAASAMSQLTVNVTNTIARGGAADIIASSDGSSGNSLAVTVQNSNFARSLTLGNGATIAATNNQSGAPSFVNPGVFDFHQTIGSPTIDSGATAPLIDLLDAENHVRIQGGGTDIGAYEFTPVSSSVTALSVTPSKFRPAKKGTMISAGKKKVPVGGMITVAVNQTSSVKLTVERAKSGRRSGTSCVAVTKKNRGHKKCTRYAGTPGYFWVTVPTGSASAKLSGRSAAKKPLAPGKYRVKAIPVAVGAAAGLPAYAKFSILR